MIKRKIENYKQELDTAKELGNKAGERAAYANLGNAYQSLCDFRQAIDYHTKALSIAKELGQRDAEGRAYCNLGNAYDSLGDFKQAIDYHTKALSIAKELGQRDAERRAYSGLGNAYQSLGDFQQAIDYHTKCLSIAKELGQRDGEGAAYGNLGNAYQSLGDFKKAIGYYTKDLSIAKELGQRYGEGATYANLGNAYYSLGDLKQAVDYHTKHLNIAKELGQRDGEGAAYANLGNAYYSLGDLKQAVDYHTKHLNIAKELGQRDGEGAAYANLGNAYYSLGDLKQAVDYHTKHLNIAKELGQRDGEGAAYCSLGSAYQSLGDLEQAKDYHTKALSIAKELGQRDGEGRAYGNLGCAYKSLGDFKQAIDYHTKDLSIAKELGTRGGERRAYANLGIAYKSLGDFKQAIDYHTKALNIAKELGQKCEEGQACYSLGRDLELTGSLHEALDYYRYSVQLYNEVRSLLQSEDIWKISFRNARKHAYTALWRTLLRLEKREEALCVAEEGRAQALMDLMKLQYHSEILASESSESKATITDILTGISTQTVFIALESNRINLWVLTGTDIHFQKKSIEDASSLMKKAFKEIGVGYHIKCENRSLDNREGDSPPNEESCQEVADSKSNSLRLLFDAVFGPIANFFKGDELIIVPDGPLCLVPYAACADEAPIYINESTRIRILPSLTTLKLIAACPEDYHSTNGALLVGDPCLAEVKGKRGKLKPLPWALKEVEMIGEIVNTKPLTGRKATKDEVLKQISAVALVHIAAHGNMEAGEIALAPNPARKFKNPQEEDYMLKMADVQAVQLRARLVVLSCCHSAQGMITPEGVVGIGRAFLGAGARSVLVSLWAIDDEATMEFMKSFYQHLARGHSASVALNRAMTCLRESEKFGAVKHWAPFVLIGDDVTIEFDGNQ
ncbi:hypothetical protein ACROYT_G042126 [Oculina patagonica]